MYGNIQMFVLNPSRNTLYYLLNVKNLDESKIWQISGVTYSFLWHDIMNRSHHIMNSNKYGGRFTF